MTKLSNKGGELTSVNVLNSIIGETVAQRSITGNSTVIELHGKRFEAIGSKKSAGREAAKKALLEVFDFII